MKWLAILLVLYGAVPALAQAPFPDSSRGGDLPGITQQQKIDDLMRLFDNPDVRRWIQTQAEQKPGPVAHVETPPPDGTSVGEIARRVLVWEQQARARFQTIISAIPHISGEFAGAVSHLLESGTGSDHTMMSAVLSLLVLFGFAVERYIRRRWRQKGRGVEHYVPIAVFAVIMAAVLFAIDWPSLIRLVVACYMLAFVAYRLVATAIEHTAHPEVHGRLKGIVGLAFVALASAAAGTLLEIEAGALHAISFLASAAILALAIELAWRKVRRGVASRVMLCLYLAAIWLLWCLDLGTLFWLGVYFILLPPIVRAIGHALREYITVHFHISPSDSRSILFVRGARAGVIGLAIAWITLVWEMDGYTAGYGGPQSATVFYGFLKSIFVLLLADLIWQLAKAAIDRNIPTVSAPAAIGEEADGATPEAHATRLHTLLPILRNVLAVALLVIAGLVILGQLGVDIAPLIAGAGIFGVAIGFGSQALVRDVISGIFYLFDDAFRVGEYIQAKNYKGTVEGFSLRSVKLRHHRGPLFTVPFGELGAVENMSRDWSKVKFSVTVPYDTNIEKARKIGKSIGQELLRDPELGPLFIQPLKMKGVEEFGEYGIVISFAMVTVPTSQQSFIRRSAYAMLREAFHTNGIAFAQPTIQVGAGSMQDAAAAAYQSSQIAKARET